MAAHLNCSIVARILIGGTFLTKTLLRSDETDGSKKKKLKKETREAGVFALSYLIKRPNVSRTRICTAGGR